MTAASTSPDRLGPFAVPYSSIRGLALSRSPDSALPTADAHGTLDSMATTLSPIYPAAFRLILIGAATLAFSFATVIAQDAAPAPEKISLWSNHAPVGDGTFQSQDPSITVHRATKPNGAAMVICPGGGYGGLVVGAEGHGIAEWLNKHGITGIVLEYRLPKGNAYVPLLDAQRAIRVARSRAQEWGLILIGSASSASPRAAISRPRRARTSTPATPRLRTRSIG
jgi:hypothetical protein